MELAIETRGICKQFHVRAGSGGRGGRRSRSSFVAVDDLNLVVRSGERIAYIGPNGAGKSTSIKILTGILHPTSGEATVLGLVPWKQRRQLAYRIGTIFGQRSQLIADLPARATFDLLARVYDLDLRDYERRRDELCDSFEAAGLLDQPVRSMSLGQRMRCELVASLLHDPKILFLDEPSIGLDLLAKRTLRQLVVQLNEQHGVTVLLTSHDVADVEHVAERVVIIDQGRAIYDGSVDELRTRFLRSKLIDVTFSDEATPPERVEGCDLLAADATSLSLRVDLDRRQLGDVLEELVSHRRVDDMTIADQPLENVIGHIYTGGAR